MSDSTVGYLTLFIRQAFARELHVWSNLSHDNILPLLGYHHNSSERILWLVSPFMEEGNVKKYLKRINLSMPFRVFLMSRVPCTLKMAFTNYTTR